MSFWMKPILRVGLIICLATLASLATIRDARATGDPWKMLVLVFRSIDVDYVDSNGTARHLTATMPQSDVDNMVNDFLHLPRNGLVYGYSDTYAELEAHVVVATRAISHISYVNSSDPSVGYWISPDDVRAELNTYAPSGMYDSVIIFWQASDPNSSQSIPSGGWGWGMGPSGWANGMTYATVFNLSWIWPIDSCRGEVFLHEWLHGVTGFYMGLGITFPPGDLHGAEQNGYAQDPNGCWETWLRDYMRGRVYVNGSPTAISEAAWNLGSVTTYNISGWRGEYYANENLGGLPRIVRNDATVNFDWQDGSPHPLLPADHFSARWTRSVPFTGGAVRFTIFHDDGARLFVDGNKIFENWCNDCHVTEQVEVTLSPGSHVLKLEIWENQGWAGASLSWENLAPACSPGANGIILYEQTYYKGRCYTFTGSHDDFNELGFNDIASSIKFVGSYVGAYVATLYEHTYKSGSSYTFSGDNPDFNSLSFNDIASSIKIEPAKDGQVSVDNVWTTGPKNLVKTTFKRGARIRYHVNISNTHNTVCTVHSVWKASNKTAVLMQWKGNLDIGSGTEHWWLTTTIPTNAPAGQYTFKVSTNCNGQKSAARTTFYVSGSLTKDVENAVSDKSPTRH